MHLLSAARRDGLMWLPAVWIDHPERFALSSAIDKPLLQLCAHLRESLVESAFEQHAQLQGQWRLLRTGMVRMSPDAVAPGVLLRKLEVFSAELLQPQAPALMQNRPLMGR